MYSKEFNIFKRKVNLEFHNTLDYMINLLPKVEINYEWSQDAEHCGEDFTNMPLTEVDGEQVIADNDYFPCDYCDCKNKTRKYEIQISFLVFTISINWI